MSLLQASIVLMVMLLLAISQLFLKAAVGRVGHGGNTPATFDGVVLLVRDWQFWAAIGIAGVVLVLWAWILSFAPLSKVYPFVVLAFVFAAVIEGALYGPALTAKFFVGCTFIFIGLFAIATQ